MFMQQQQFTGALNTENKETDLKQLSPFNQFVRTTNSPAKHSTNKIELSKTSHNEWSNLLSKLVNGTPISDKTPNTTTLYLNNKCQWPGCKQSTQFESFESFVQKHLIKEHKLDEESHGQILKQMNIIETIENELNKQKQLLNEMLHHLNNQLNAVKQQQQQQQEFALFNQQQQQIKQENPLFMAAIAAAVTTNAPNTIRNDLNNKENKNDSDNDLTKRNNLTVAAHLQSVNSNTNKMPVLNNSTLSTYSMPNQQRKQLEKSPISLGNG